jgi:hypothetical protein
MNAFIDANGILLAWGYMESNNQDTKIENVPDDQFPYDAMPGQYKYIGPDPSDWVPYTPPPNYVPENAGIRMGLMNVADAATYGLLDAYVTGILGGADKSIVELWASYKLALSKVDLSQAAPAWPAVPSV